MKIILTGSLGNISKPLAAHLVAQGQEVTIISSDSKKTDEIINIGAVPAIGSVTDEAFLTTVFNGADLVYLMVPNDFSASDLKAYIKEIGEHYANAIQTSGVKKVVLLSSIGAHLAYGTGPIAGLYAVEQIFRSLKEVDILFLRPAYFYNNLYANINLIKNAGIIGANYGADLPIVLVDPQDIAVFAANQIAKGFSGHTTLYIASDKRTLQEVATQIGKAIDKPELPWVAFDDKQALEGMIGAGLPAEIAKNYVEMGNAINSGILWEDFELNKVEPIGETKLEDFAVKFAAAYRH